MYLVHASVIRSGTSNTDRYICNTVQTYGLKSYLYRGYFTHWIGLWYVCQPSHAYASIIHSVLHLLRDLQRTYQYLTPMAGHQSLTKNCLIFCNMVKSTCSGLLPNMHTSCLKYQYPYLPSTFLSFPACKRAPFYFLLLLLTSYPALNDLFDPSAAIQGFSIATYALGGAAIAQAFKPYDLIRLGRVLGSIIRYHLIWVIRCSTI